MICSVFVALPWMTDKNGVIVVISEFRKLVLLKIWWI